MNKKLMMQVLSLILAVVLLTTSVSTAQAAGSVKTTEQFYQELAELLGRQDDSHYFASMELKLGSNILTVDGKEIEMDVMPDVLNGRTMLPIRPIAEAAGAEVEYEAISHTAVVISSFGDEIRCPIGSTAMLINGIASSLDVATYTKNNRTYLPVRAVAEALEMEVEWDQATSTVTLSAPYQTARVLAWSDKIDLRGLNANTVLQDGTGLWVLQFDTPSEAKEAVGILQARGIVAEADQYIQLDDEPQASSVTAQSSNLSWGVADCHFDLFLQQNNFSGSGVVAVVDSGVDSSHPFLTGRVLPGYDFADGDSDPNDDHSHGTHVAGTIIDCVGSAPVKILPVRVLKADGKGHATGSDVNVVLGIKYAADRGADVINLSLGGSHSDVQDKAIQYAIEKGSLVVVSAGNDVSDTSTYCPAHITTAGTVVVSAGNSQHNRWFNYNGKDGGTNYGSSVDLMAPGVNILSSIPDGKYGRKTGTSMAAPHVSAAAILLDLVWNKSLTPSQLETIVRTATTNKGNWDNQFMGCGFLDMSNADVPHTHSYDSVGKCACGETFHLSITSLNQKMTVSSVNGTDTAPAHNAPYGDATVTKRYTKGQVVTVNGSAKNAFGNLWYRLSDNTWVNSGYLSSHTTHSYDSVGKCACGETFQLSITGLNQKMIVTSVNGTDTAPAHNAPYGDATVTKRYTKGQAVTVTGSAKNAFGNLWYRLPDNTWVSSGYLSSHTTHSYDSVGKCACGETFQLSITGLNQKMIVTSVNGTDTAPAHNAPYGDATVTKRYTKGQAVTVTGSAKNAFGNLWYRLSDNTWVSSGYLSSHTTHSYDSVGKCACGEMFQLSISKLNQKMTISAVNNTNTAPAHSTPYGDATITKRYYKDQVVTVTGSAKNAFGNLWYQLSDGTWVVSSYLSTHLHTWEGAGKCSSCGKTYTLNITTLSSNKKGTITAVNGSSTAPTHATPYGDATIKTRYKKGQSVTVKAQAKNAYGNLWYQLTNNEWILAEYVTLK